MNDKYVYYNVILNYRQKVNDAGMPVGNPELTHPSFVKEKFKTKEVKVVKQLEIEDVGEVEWD